MHYSIPITKCTVLYFCTMLVSHLFVQLQNAWLHTSNTPPVPLHTFFLLGITLLCYTQGSKGQCYTVQMLVMFKILN
jgi:hypothetical protein